MKRTLRTTYTSLPVASPPSGRGAAELRARSHRRRTGTVGALMLSLVLYGGFGAVWWFDMNAQRGMKAASSAARAVAIDATLSDARVVTFDAALEGDEHVEWDAPDFEPMVVSEFELADEVDVDVADIEPDRLDAELASGAPSARQLAAMMTVRAVLPRPAQPPAVEPEPIEWPEWLSDVAPVTPDTPAEGAPEVPPSDPGDTDTVVFTRPEPRPDNPPPKYPRIARRRGWEGVVILSVRVLATGLVDDAFVLVTSGRAVLDDAALEAVLGWHFEPARRGDEAIPGRRDVSIRFELK